jgi:methyl acetate hydrolase
MGRALQHLLLDRPASGVAGVIMMQILPFADANALKLYRQFEREIYRAQKSA